MRIKAGLLLGLAAAWLLGAAVPAAAVAVETTVVPPGDLIDCKVSADATTTTEPKNPYKKADGYYDQGTARACVFTSLVNANISAGVDDTGGKFMKRFRLCLFRKGRVNSWRRGVVVPGPEYDDMLRCKEEARAANGTSSTTTPKVATAGDAATAEPAPATEVHLKVLPESDPWATREQAICDTLSTTPKGAATIQTKHGTNHMSSVESIDCDANEMVIRDPEDGLFTITYDDTGKITGCSPADAHYNGATIAAVTVETTGP